MGIWIYPYTVILPHLCTATSEDWCTFSLVDSQYVYFISSIYIHEYIHYLVHTFPGIFPIQLPIHTHFFYRWPVPIELTINIRYFRIQSSIEQQNFIGIFCSSPSSPLLPISTIRCCTDSVHTNWIVILS